MARKNLDSLFDDVQSSLNDKESSGGGNFQNFLKLEKDKEYDLRLIPNRDDPKKTFFAYRYHGWKSFVTGNYVQYLCPSMVGDPSPINIESWRIDKEGDEADKEKGKALWRKDAWLVNVYVINDPSNPENNGEVKILRMGKQLKAKIDDAMADKEQFGMRIFDLSPQGSTFRIKVNYNGRYNEYNSSQFRFPTEISEIGDDDDKIEEIEGQAHDLENIFTIEPYKVLKEALDYHYYEKLPEGESNNTQNSPTKEEANTSSKEEKKVVKEEKKVVKEEKKVVEEEEESDLIDDDEINDMLSELED